MKNVAVMLAGIVLAVLMVGQTARAEGWPFSSGGSKAIKKPVSQSTKAPSPWEQLGEGTKKFFTQAKDTLTWKKPAPKKKPTNQYAPWIREPKQQPKKTLWDSLFARKEPPPPNSVGEWMQLPRADPGSTAGAGR